MPDEDEQEDAMQDSLRAQHTSHRRPEVSGQIAAEIRRVQDLKGSIEPNKQQPTSRALPKRGRMVEDSLPLAPHRAAKLGLTAILPPAKVRNNEKFRFFIQEITDPDFRTRFPTWMGMAEHFGVGVATLKTWMLSEEAGLAMKASVAHEALMHMPSIIRSVRMRAEITGDPHAAEFVRKVAKLGTAELDQAKSFENTLRQIALSRASGSAKLAEAKVIEEGGNHGRLNGEQAGGRDSGVPQE